MSAPWWWWVAFATERGPAGAVITKSRTQSGALRRAMPHAPSADVTGLALPVPRSAGEPPADVTDKLLAHFDALAAWDRWVPGNPAFGIVEIDPDTGEATVATDPDDDVRVS